MNKRLLIAGTVVGSVFLAQGIAMAETEKERERHAQLVQRLNQLPDSLFEGSENRDLLEHDLYRSLANEGWSRTEIMAIMSTSLKDKALAKTKKGYVEYTKEWLPEMRSDATAMGIIDPLDPAPVERTRAAVAKAGIEDQFNKVWPQIPYSPDDRRNGLRRPGYFRQMLFDPACGRVNWCEVNPDDPDKIMILPDGAGIMRTDDGGLTWRCITDNIPDRAYRDNVDGYSIPVDPTDWNHVFAFANGGAIYETFDGGDSWTRVEGARHHGFKRGRCIVDAQGNLRLIGCNQAGTSGYLRISEDKGRTWTTVDIPEDLKDPIGGTGLWFQEIHYDPFNRDRIFLPTGRSIMYFDDGARPTVNPDGSKTYHIKKLNCKVYGFTKEGEPRNSADPSRFPFPGNSPGFMVVDGNVEGRMWYHTHANQQDALFYTDDGGKTWRTIIDQVAGINGESRLAGGESAATWLGGFGVNVKDAPYRAYSTTLNTQFTTGDYVNGQHPSVGNLSWADHLKGRNTDGSFTSTTSVGHNSDNHFIISHPKSGRIYRGSDAGFYILDKNINNGNWFNAGTGAGWTLFYAMCTNEFGDQCVIGNTQDINVQTYYYGRWGQKNGYEGSHCSINPFNNTGYYSANGTEGFEDPGLYMQNNSWQSLLSRADVTTGAWYLRHDGNRDGYDFERFDDFGRSGVAIRPNVGEQVRRREWGICRDKGISTIYVIDRYGKVLKSTDSGSTFANVTIPGGGTLGWSGNLAVDPDDSNTLYLGTRGLVKKWNVERGTGTDLTRNGLPDVDCAALFFHEGSGDLYFVSSSSGIYLLENGATAWRFWDKGRNATSIRDIHINYTTQEMVLCTWGKGMWAADLEHPCDRFYKPGFALKERSHVDGRRTIGVDSEWTTPHYHTYRWWVNDVEVDNPYPYLTRKLNAGDRVRLELSLRESPDVHTQSAEFTVADTPEQTLQRVGGNALYSDGGGRIDLGNHEWFNKDFTVEMWLNPESNGTVIGNRQKNIEQGSRGWTVFIENGRLYLRYAPRNRYFRPTYEGGQDMEGVLTYDLGAIPLNKWSHFALTCSLTEGFRAYVNGVQTASFDRWQPERDINNSMNLGIMGDGNDWNGLRGAVDELKIWTRALGRDEIRTELYSTNINDADGLAVYYDFNGNQPLANYRDLVVTGRSPWGIGREQLDVQRSKARNGQAPTLMHEAFSGLVPVSRIRAVTSATPSLSVLHADKVALANVGAQLVAMTAADGTEIVALSQQTGSEMELGAYRYDTEHWLQADDNLDAAYYDICSSGYVIRAFSDPDAKTDATVVFYPAAGQSFNPHRGYRLYTAEIDGAKPYWVRGANLTCDPEGNSLVYTGPLADVRNRKLIIVAPKAGIEVSIDGMDSRGRVQIFDDRNPSIHITARAIEGLAEPDGKYELMSDNGLLVPMGALQFTQGTAALDLKVDMAKFTGSSAKTVLRAKNDNRMIPLEIELINSVTPRTIGTSTTIQNGGLQVGTAEDWAVLNGTNEFTMMGWMRIDDMPFSGQRPFLMFNNGAQRIGYYSHDSGWVRGFYNSEGWLQNNASSHDISPTRGKWVHIAYVARKNAVDIYMNGVRWSRGNDGNRPMSPAVITSPLYLGQMGGGDTWFSGAFDQISVWKRPLGGDEVVKFMQERVPLNADGLVAYLTMDETRDGKLVELVKGMPVSQRGTVSHHTPSVMPYDGRNRYEINGASADKVLTFKLPGATRYGYVTTYDGQPYGYLNSERGDLIPLNRESYTLVYTNYYGSSYYSSPVSTARCEVTYRHPSIIAGEAVTMGVRTLGATDAITTYVEAKSVADGVAVFDAPYVPMMRACDIMFFSPVGAAQRECRLEFSIDENTDAEGRLMLREHDNSVTVTASVVAGNPAEPVQLYVKEPYATPAAPTLDFNGAQQVKFEVTLDREKMDRFGLNPVTVGAVGMQANEASVVTYIEPYIELSLRGSSANPAVHNATTSVSTLDVEARHVEGWLNDELRLKVTSDNVNTHLNAASGKLLANHPVDITGLEYDPSTQRCQHQGLNLIGNPFLTNINLTRADNVNYDADRLTKFIYQVDPETGNYRVYDMTVYDQAQLIKPFQAYFVQAMGHDAALTISPRAKTTAKVSHKQRRSVYEAVGVSTLTLQLLRDGRELDRTMLRMGDGVAEFNLNEDAPKLWSLNPKAAQLCLYTAATHDDHADIAGPAGPGDVQTRVNVPTAVNSYCNTFTRSDVGLKIGEPGEYEIRMTDVSSDLLNTDLYLFDNAAGYGISLFPDAQGVQFTVTPEMVADGPVDLGARYFLGNAGTRGDDWVTGVADVKGGYEVCVENNRVTVNGLRGDASVFIYRPNGVAVTSGHTVEASWSATLEAGVYLVKILEQGSESIAKIAVK